MIKTRAVGKIYEKSAWAAGEEMRTRRGTLRRVSYRSLCVRKEGIAAPRDGEIHFVLEGIIQVSCGGLYVNHIHHDHSNFPWDFCPARIWLQ